MKEKVGIICAADTELEPFLSCLRNAVVTEKAMLKFYEGTIGKVPVVVLYGGVCKVNAAIAAQILIDSFSVSAVINAGVAGGMASEVKLFDTIVTVQSAYHDMTEDILTEFHPWMPSVWFESDAGLLEKARTAERRFSHPVLFGKTVTGEQFINNDRRSSINAAFSPLSVDMETAAIAHACYVNRVPFLAVRSITDTADHSGAEHFEGNCEKAAGIARDFVLLLLEEWQL